jgi:hypothetical protein
VLGVSVPRGVLSRELRRVIDPLTLALFVPLFFVYSGLNTRVMLIDSPALCPMVFAIACAGDGLGCWAAARLSGAASRPSLALASLMNARGMVELILLNLGLQRGVITPTLFAMLVIMALTTTLMTGPVFSAIWNGDLHEAVPRWLASDTVPSPRCISRSHSAASQDDRCGRKTQPQGRCTSEDRRARPSCHDIRMTREPGVIPVPGYCARQNRNVITPHSCYAAVFAPALTDRR